MIYSSYVHGTPATREQEYLAGWQRARADLDNFRKRILSEQEQQHHRLRAEVGQALLEVADSFHAVIQHTPAKLKEDSWAQGVLHVARQFKRLLADYGIDLISAVDQTFDPTLHEAVAKTKKEGTRGGRVVEVLQPGYKMGNIVIRPAKVKVAE